VKVKQPFTPDHGGSATLVVNKDRHGGLRKHCPNGDREPLAGTFKLLAFTDEDARSRLKWQKQRTANAMRTWREQHHTNTSGESA
jgi:hypothetical protein